MNFTIQNNRFTMYMMTIKHSVKTRKKAAFRDYDDMPLPAVSFWSYHLSTCGPRAFPAPLGGLPLSHTTRDGIKNPVPQSFRRFIGLRCVSCNICKTHGFLESFSAKKQCVKNFRLHVKKWWWLSPPLLKVVVTCNHRHIQSCAYGDRSVLYQNRLQLK